MGSESCSSEHSPKYRIPKHYWSHSIHISLIFYLTTLYQATRKRNDNLAGCDLYDENKRAFWPTFSNSPFSVPSIAPFPPIRSVPRQSKFGAYAEWHPNGRHRKLHRKEHFVSCEGVGRGIWDFLPLVTLQTLLSLLGFYPCRDVSNVTLYDIPSIYTEGS